MTLFRPLGGRRGGDHHPISVEQFIIDFLRINRKSYSGEMHRAYNRRLDEIAQEKGRGKPYRKPTAQSFYRKVWELAKLGKIKPTGEQTELTERQFSDMDNPPVKTYYRLP